MSLKFLAVGQSFAGVRDEKSPYALRKESRLPTFDGSPRFARVPEKRPVQTDWLAPSVPAPEPVQAGASAPDSSPPIVAKSTRRWFSIFKLKWFRATKPKSDLVQSELSLENVRVLRNDLADADLELVLKKRKKIQPLFASSQSNNALERHGWSELTAKLFEIGQK